VGEIAGAFLFPESVHVTTVQTSKSGGFVTFTSAGMDARGYGVSAVGQF
jgi:hypothetical protein